MNIDKIAQINARKYNTLFHFCFTLYKFKIMHKEEMDKITTKYYNALNPF